MTNKFIKQKSSQDFFIRRLIQLEAQVDELDKSKNIDNKKRNDLVRTIELYSNLIDKNVKLKT